MDKCKECHRYDKCKSIVDRTKVEKNPLLAVMALVHCPLWEEKIEEAQGWVK